MSRMSSMPCDHSFLPFQASQMSPVVRHRWPTGAAQRPGRLLPHSQMDSTMSRPDSRSALAMMV